MVPHNYRNIKTSDLITGISGEIPPEGITFKEFLKLIGDHGILLSCAVLVAPFLIPVSIPGSSLPFGLAIALLNISLLLGGRNLLPGPVMNYQVSQESMIRILNGMKRILSGLERFSNPRFMVMTSTLTIKHFNSVIIIWCAFLLMLPLPIPLTDSLPAYSILFLAVGSLERDGYLILAGYVTAVLTSVYFGLMILLGLAGVKLILSYLGITI